MCRGVSSGLTPGIVAQVLEPTVTAHPPVQRTYRMSGEEQLSFVGRMHALGSAGLLRRSERDEAAHESRPSVTVQERTRSGSYH